MVLCDGDLPADNVRAIITVHDATGMNTGMSLIDAHKVRRDVDSHDSTDQFHLTIQAGFDIHVIRLKRDASVLAGSEFKSTYVTEDGEQLEHNTFDKRCVYSGKTTSVINDEQYSCHVTATVCDGKMIGLIKCGKNMKAIIPSNDNLDQNKDTADHVMYNVNDHELFQERIKRGDPTGTTQDYMKPDKNDNDTMSQTEVCIDKTFKRFPGTAMPGTPKKSVPNLTRDGCKAACLQETTFVCKACDYNMKTKECRLNTESVATASHGAPGQEWFIYYIVECKSATKCKATSKGREYVGTKSTTLKGHTCQRWDSQTPHSHTRNNPDNFPEKTLADAANYCRNPDGEPGGPWCYTTNPGERFEYCGIPFCNDDNPGLVNVTLSDCQTKGGNFYDNHCYWISSGQDAKGHVEAKSACANLGARLVSLDTANEYSSVKALIANKTVAGESRWMTSGLEVGVHEPRQWAWDLGSWYKPAHIQLTGMTNDKDQKCIIIKNGSNLEVDNCHSATSDYYYVCEAGEESLDERPANFETSMFIGGNLTAEISKVYNGNLQDMTNYIVIFVNGLGAMLHDPNLVRPISTTVTRVFFHQNTPLQWYDTDKTDCQHLGKVSSYQAAHAERSAWDVAHFLVKSVCGAVGWGWVGGLCHNKYSTSICQANAHFSGIVCLAHELGHVMGMKHDASYKERSDCFLQSPSGYMMSGGSTGFSPCGAESFKNKMRSFGPSACLYDNTYEDYELANMVEGYELPGQRFDINKQCETNLGANYSYMRDDGNKGYMIGSSLGVCENDIQCINYNNYDIRTAKGVGNLEGTYCSGTKWCRRNTRCTDWTTDADKLWENLGRPQVVQGGWSPWGLWTQCTSTCGAGVRKRVRFCDSPKPKNTRCPGSYYDAELCNTQACINSSGIVEQDIRDLGQQICRNHSTSSELTGYIEWAGLRTLDVNDCKQDILGKKYTGKVSRTVSGRQCQRWDSQIPHKHKKQSVLAAENFCRNPDNESGGPWCYTTDPNKRWEYCGIPLCTAGIGCKPGSMGKLYMGKMNITSGGKECKRWDSQSRQGVRRFQENSLAAAENFCRNPDGDKGGPWCYTHGLRWQFCNVPICGGDNLCDVNCYLKGSSGSRRSAFFPDGTLCSERNANATEISMCIEGYCKAFTLP
ncbi:unnamed protein product [Owenia fusiformis]|uniref:Uncharacterized protein n=1 Tax=Owenia fusiformis TaxID=6347 RepID=A0A8J1XKY1_OWEFU|nr:unnamed protein product [Owenia fusiformis]